MSGEEVHSGHLAALAEYVSPSPGKADGRWCMEHGFYLGMFDPIRSPGLADQLLSFVHSGPLRASDPEEGVCLSM